MEERVVNSPVRAHILPMVRSAFDISRLTVAERLELIDALWTSLRTRDAVLAPLTPEEVALIEARRTDHKCDPSSAIPWETVRADLLADQASDEAVITERSPKHGV